MNNINTTVIDSIMQELGWRRYKETYIFYRKTKDKQWPYYASMPTDVYSMYLIYQEWYNTGKWSRAQVKEYLKKYFEHYTYNTYIKKKALKLALAMLAADYFWHNPNRPLHKKYVTLYEQLTGKKY